MAMWTVKVTGGVDTYTPPWRNVCVSYDAPTARQAGGDAIRDHVELTGSDDEVWRVYVWPGADVAPTLRPGVLPARQPDALATYEGRRRADGWRWQIGPVLGWSKWSRGRQAADQLSGYMEGLTGRTSPDTVDGRCHFCGLPLRHGVCGECG